jgi:hypothetical protein
MWVQNVVLDQEDRVENNGGDTQDELDEVKGTCANHWLAKGESVDEDLQKAEQTTSQVKQHVGQGPADRALALLV